MCKSSLKYMCSEPDHKELESRLEDLLPKMNPLLGETKMPFEMTLTC